LSFQGEARQKVQQVKGRQQTSIGKITLRTPKTRGNRKGTDKLEEGKIGKRLCCFGIAKE